MLNDCWKIVLCSPDTKQRDQWEQKNQVGQLEAGPWLFSNIVSSAEDNNNDDLAKTPHSLLIWKKWVPSLSGTDITCCLSVVKDAILFTVSCNIPWKLQKAQLHNHLNLVPPDSCLPLMILSGSYYVDGSNPSSVIVNELGLQDIDKSQVSAFLVVFLAGKQHSEGSTGFFSDEKLREGLKWLANESPLQPVLSCVKTHKLVVSDLSPVLEELGKMSDYEVGPNHCISVFNEALDWLMGEIAAVIKANPMNWPCPETMLLKDFSDELLAVRLFLPSVQWSSALKTALLEHTLKECRLSCFPDDISLLQSGPKMGKYIDNHRLLLENCLNLVARKQLLLIPFGYPKTNCKALCCIGDGTTIAALQFIETLCWQDRCASEKSLTTEPYVSDCEMLRILRLPFTGLMTIGLQSTPLSVAPTPDGEKSKKIVNHNAVNQVK
ncbi:hypothetical protein V6N13_060774 [Hibiscus sabdariffa]|uniref:Uncharacterized protein n=1 Tax=Hibiscus sabdariffa TaxID=183260 RepID=A0ABR2P6R2_9ROSI